MISQITKMRLPDGTEVAFVDWQDQPIWSTAYMGTSFTDDEVNFFTYAPGDVISATSNCTAAFQSTWRDTNVSLAGAFAETEEMLVYAIKPEVSIYDTTNLALDTLTPILANFPGYPNANLTQLKLLSDLLILRLWVSQKVMIEGPFGYFNAGFGPAGQSSRFTATTTTLKTNGTQGMPTQEAVRSLAMPVYIGGTEKWRVTASNFTGGAVAFGLTEADTPAEDASLVARVRIILDGIYKRPVS